MTHVGVRSTSNVLVPAPPTRFSEYASVASASTWKFVCAPAWALDRKYVRHFSGIPETSRLEVPPAAVLAPYTSRVNRPE